MSTITSARRRNRGKFSPGFLKQRDYVTQCACACFESRSIRRTTLADIARESNMTRELLYYYFSGKEEIVSCVIDGYVRDAADTALLWCEEWDTADVEDDATLVREAVLGAVRTLRRFVFLNDGSKRPMFSVIEENGNVNRVVLRMCREIEQSLPESRVVSCIRTAFGCLTDEQAHEALGFIVLGSIGMMEDNVVDDKRLAALILGSAAG